VFIGLGACPVRISWTLPLVCALVAASPVPQSVRAAEYTVHLVTESAHGRFLFEPPVLFAEPGDIVHFVPDDPMHAIKSIAGMLPEGAVSWRGRMGEEIVVRLDRPGVYGVKCRSGYDVGMVGLVVVGDDPPNFAQAQTVRHPPAASMAFAAMFAAVGCRLRLTSCPD
jgi:pseudoazurin